MVPVILELQARDAFDVRICTTGQHRQMLDQVMELFQVTADVDLAIMKPDQTLSGITGDILSGLGETLETIRPDCVLVHGDTTTTMAASLSAYYHRIPVAHVEAGLRTRDKLSPWPEEMNRRITGSIADLHFCPTPLSRDNLLAENVPADTIHVTGNTVIDALFRTLELLRSDDDLQAPLAAQFDFLDPAKRLLLVTGHRRESFGAGFGNICDALLALSARDDLQIVYPVHMNPSVKGPVTDTLGGRANIHLIEPVDYVPFVYLMNKATLILTDSGGVQEEAPSLGTPVLVMRDKTERPEGVQAGVVKLVGTAVDAIVGSVTELLDDRDAYQRMTDAGNPYGDGTAAVQIADVLERVFVEARRAR